MSETTPTTETGYLDVAGGRLYYEVAGAGHALVLLHADVADSRMWDEQVATFAQHYRVVRLDKRGFGKTTTTASAFSYRQDIMDLLTHLGIERTAILGLSNGGGLALDFTLEHPERVDALIVVAGGVGGFDFDEASVTEAERQLYEEYEAVQQRHDTAGLVEVGIRMFGDGPGQPEGRAAASVREKMREMMTNNERLHPEELQPEPLEPRAIARLGDIHIPTLVILGGLDETVTNAMMSVLAERVAGAQKVVFPDTAHMVNMEQPERFNTVVLEFLRDAVAS